jgi:hypothetical protein
MAPSRATRITRSVAFSGAPPPAKVKEISEPATLAAMKMGPSVLPAEPGSSPKWRMK